MKHDVAHEEKQNACLRLLAGALMGCARSGGYHVGDLVSHVNEVLGKDESDHPGVDPEVEVEMVEAVEGDLL